MNGEKSRLRLPVFIFLVFVTLGAVPTVWGQEPQNRQLIERFKANKSTNHQEAYEAAKEYIKKNPSDVGEDAQYMRRWIQAYEKVANVVQNEGSANSQGDSSLAALPPTESKPSLLATVKWMNDFLSSNPISFETNRRKDVKYKFVSNINRSITRFEDCSLEIEEAINQPPTDVLPGQRSVAKQLIPLSSVDPLHISIVYENDFYTSASMSPGSYRDQSLLPYEEVPILTGNAVYVRFKTNQNRKDINHRTKWRQQEYNMNLDWGQVVFNEKREAERFANAMKHAAELCKGKETRSPF